MDPVLVTILVVAVLVVGVIIGWEVRLLKTREDIKAGKFDPWKDEKTNKKEE